MNKKLIIIPLLLLLTITQINNINAKKNNINKAKNIDKNYVLVNKNYYLPKDYIPNNLETINSNYAINNMKLVNVAKIAFEKMAFDAKKENLNIVAMSTYRSYEYQENLYNNYVKQDGKEQADTYSAHPGHSEHQTGLSVDVFNLKESFTNFENTKEFEWINKNAHKYGFILRFPKGKEKITGYTYEAWHYRYVGEKIAKEIKEKNLTLEEYYKIKDW